MLYFYKTDGAIGLFTPALPWKLKYSIVLCWVVRSAVESLDCRGVLTMLYSHETTMLHVAYCWLNCHYCVPFRWGNRLEKLIPRLPGCSGMNVFTLWFFFSPFSMLFVSEWEWYQSSSRIAKNSRGAKPVDSERKDQVLKNMLYSFIYS